MVNVLRDAPGRPPHPLHFWQVWKSSGRSSGTSFASLRMECGRFPAAEARLLRHYFRLVAQERPFRLGFAVPESGGAEQLPQMELERQRLGRDCTPCWPVAGCDPNALKLSRPEFRSRSRVSTGWTGFRPRSADALEQVRSVSKRLHPPDVQGLRLNRRWRQRGI